VLDCIPVTPNNLPILQ